ncbi:MAG TPA: hypothetical protein VFT74_09280, partial [Isosphaeraceae bacterium]|nr:hypothetical protein [Isosphaeraceae bacterium]
VLLEYAGYLTLLELGLSGAVAPMLAQALSQDDTVKLRQVLAASSRTYLRVTVITLVVGMLIWFLVPMGKLVPLHPRPGNLEWWAQVVGATSLPFSAIGMINLADLNLAWLIILAGTLLLVVSPYRALVEANQRGYQINLLLLVQALVTVTLSLVLAYRGGGISGQCLANLLGLLPTYAVLLLMALHRYSSLILKDLTAPVDPEIRQQMKDLSRASLKLQICGRASFMTDAIVLGLFLGSSQVTVLFVTQRLAVLVQTLLNSIGAAVWAGLADLHGRGEHELFQRRLLEITKILSLLGVATLGPIVAGNASFVSLWVGPSEYGGMAVTLVAAANAYLFPLFVLWSWCFSGTGQSPLVVRVTILSAAVNLTASVALTGVLKLMVGPLLGTLIAFLTILMRLYPRLLRTHFGVPESQLLHAVLKPLVIGLPVSAVGWLLIQIFPPSNLLVIVLELGMTTLLILALGYRFLLDSFERQEWLDRVAPLLRGLDRFRPRPDESSS